MDALSVVAPLTGLVSGMSSFYNTFAQEQMNYEQIKLAREQMARQEYAQREQNLFAHREALDAWNRQVAYNSPLAQRRRLSAAGINPFSGQPAQYSPELSSQQAQPATAGLTPVMPSLHTPPSPLEGLVDSLTGFAPMMKAIAEAKKVGVDTRLAEMTLDDNVKLAGLQREFQGFQNDLEKIQLKFANSKEAAIVQNLLEDINIKAQQAALNHNESELKKIMIDVQKETIKNIRENSDLTNRQKQYLIKQLDTFDIMNSLQQNVLRSEAYQHYMQGYQAKEQGDTIVELRDWQSKDLQEAIQNKQFERAKFIIEAIMKGNGIGQAPWTAAYNAFVNRYNELRSGDDHLSTEEIIRKALAETMKEYGPDKNGTVRW